METRNQTIHLNSDVVSTPASQTVMGALSARHTSREFADRPLTDSNLSQLLWAAYGINRPDGRRTAPAAMGIYSLRLFVFTPKGIYLYQPADHALLMIEEGDKRHLAGIQDFVATAPISIVVFSDFNAFKGDSEVERIIGGHEQWMSALDAGACAENVYLYCASQGINVVERMMVDENSLKETLSLPDSYHFQVALTAGYPK